ncbi:MAG TPA: HNH endonuclease [Caldithrix abyssi]|uniref:HNH endonuclease n=1 Tax=Caldithrix abyssi TaxID=187145 RepID=A0A7V5RN88_CALAY|nr:HNH endonuclease [Caldithrix abyssi]
MKQSVLVLNQNYVPISICSARKAVILLLLNKAQMIERYEDAIHSARQAMPYPSVIRLNRYIRRPYQTVSLNRKNIVKRDRNRCQYCGKNHQPMTIDHIIPRSQGGRDTWENLVCACFRCNHKKGDRTPEQAGMKLLRKPTRPTHLFYLQYLANGHPHPTWQDYLFLN